jgi:hypothetical protein
MAPPVRRLRTLLAAAAAVALGVAPLSVAAAASGSAGVVHLQVNPALPGVRLDVAGVVTTTDGNGRAVVSLGNINNVAHRVRLASHRASARTSVSILRVSPQPHLTPHVSNLTVGLEARSAVRLSIDPGITGVPAADVSQLQLHSLAGQVVTVNPQRHPTVMLLSSRSMLQHNVPRAQEVTWTVDRVVTSDGATVTTDRHRFAPRTAPVWTVRLAPVAGTVHLQTLPPVPGVQVELGRQTLTTERQGRVTAPVADLNAVYRRVRLVSPAADADSARVSLLHVAHLPPGQIGTRRLLLALRVSRPVRLRFVDEGGGAVPSARVERVRLSQGGRVTVLRSTAGFRQVWLPTEVARNAHGRWRAHQLRYSLRTAEVDGANAVFRGRQHFVAGAATTWRVRLSLFPLAVTVRDALFGHQTSSAVVLRLPDGKDLDYRVGGGSPTVIPALARGLYRVDVEAAVIGKTSSVLVSQSGAADLRVITALDVAAVVTALLLVAVGLVAVGRVLARRQPTTLSRHAR